MKVRHRAIVFLLLVCPILAGAAGEPPAAVDEALRRYLHRTDPPLVAFGAFRHLEAATRGGATRGWVDACTMLDETGFRYRVVGEGGSGLIRKRVLVAALEEERRMRSSGDSDRVAILPSNYRFSTNDPTPDGLVRIGLFPRRKEQALIEGAMYVEPESGALVRVNGALAKRPSFWTRHVEVNRQYEAVTNVWVPVSTRSEASVLIVGKSSFAMTYEYLTVNGAPVPGGEEQAAICESRESPAETTR